MAPTQSTKRHLMVGIAGGHTACGLDAYPSQPRHGHGFARLTTTVLADVTCGACKRSLVMADTEMRAAHSRRR